MIKKFNKYLSYKNNFLYLEEIDLCKRLRANNYKIYGLINGIIFAQLIIVTISLLGALYYLKKQL